MIKILRLILITLSFMNLYSQKISGNYIVSGVIYRAGDGNYRSNFIYDIFVSLDTKGNLKITSYQFLSVLSDEKFFAETAEIKNPHFNREKLTSNGIKGISYYGDIVNTKNGNYSFISVNFTVLVLENEIVGMYINKSHGNKEYLLMLKPIKKTETVNIKELRSINKEEVEKEVSKDNFKEEILEYHKNGSVKKKQIYNFEDKTHIISEYQEDGKIQYVQNYKDGLASGESIIYNDKGFMYLKTNYFNGKRNGKETHYEVLLRSHQNVVVEEGNYKDDYKEGVWTTYQYECSDPDCKTYYPPFIWVTSNYVLGELQGEQVQYNMGKLQTKEYYKNGKKDGLWEQFDTETGKKWQDELYQDGILIKETKYEN